MNFNVLRLRLCGSWHAYSVLQPGWLKSGDSHMDADVFFLFFWVVQKIKRGGPLNFALLGSPLFNQPGGCEILSCAWDIEVFNQEGGQLKVSDSSFAVKGDLHSLCLVPLHSHAISCTRHRMSLDNPLD